VQRPSELAYSRLRAHCEHSGDAPWQALEKLSGGTLSLKNVGTLIKSFEEIRVELEELSEVQSDLSDFIDAIFPAEDLEIEELRELALDVVENCKTPKELLQAMMDEITQPDVPPTVEEVRVMSLHKSKGLSSPYVFVAACVQGVLRKCPMPTLPRLKPRQISKKRADSFSLVLLV
jgi:ATP-dependent exoDNAse (exonuclease V) beta subunit